MYGVNKCRYKSKLLHYLTANAFHSSTSCHYATLGIVRHASEKDIRTAYVQMAKKYHPDVNTDSNATQTFSSINEAYSILSDRGKKQKYDSEIGNLLNSTKNWWDFNFYGKNTSNTNEDKTNAHNYDDFEFAQDFYGDFSRFTTKKTSQQQTNTHHNKKRNGFKNMHDNKKSNPYADYYYYYEQQTNPQNKQQSKQYTNIWSDFEFDINVEEEFDSEFNNEAFWRFIRNNNRKQRAKHNNKDKDTEKENGNNNKSDHNKYKQKHSKEKKKNNTQSKDKQQQKKADTKEETKTKKHNNDNNKKNNKNNKNKKDEVTANDIEINLKLDFLEAANGCTKTISFKRNEICTKCGGSTYETSIECQPCLKCDGKGYLLSYGHDIMCNKYKCVECGGRGIIFKNCTQCSGSGSMRDINKSLSIRIPSGIRENDRVRVSKQGNQYHDAYKQVIKYGHIVINCKIETHEYFERYNNDIYCSMNIPYCLAVLGGTFVVPTIHGPVIQKVAAPIQHNHCLQINEKGIYDSSTNKTGHMFVYFMLNIPQQDEITQKQKQLLNEYAKLEQAPTPTKMKQNIKQQMKRKSSKRKMNDDHNSDQYDNDNDLNDLL